ncbi:MAG: hypothetical protein EAX86_08400 [Candidatus Heimdallarchaeota archaeon]|nr:hypothetical protein [Candidatus Heimdallarchaeota archaeon]
MEEKPIPLGQVYELLTIREEAGINYVQRVTAQHAEKLSRDAAYSEEVLQALQNEFGLSRMIAVQLVNTNPRVPTDVKAVVGTSLSKNDIERLLERYLEFVAQLSSLKTKKDVSQEEEEESEESEEGFEDL